MEMNDKDQLICNHCENLATMADDCYWPHVAICCNNSSCIEAAKEALFEEAVRDIDIEED
tara:strand:+ start:371 stop:550 length:180 start_codon:yes stop_codon:yes gene_type:complete